MVAGLALFAVWSAPAGASPTAASSSDTVTGGAPPPAALGHCRTATLVTALPDGTAARIVGHLCTPRRAEDRSAVQLLVHGATYNSSYWSWSQDPAYYSYVWRALAAGGTTFAMDRLGDGASTQPFSALDTYTAQASVVHQVALALKDGRLGRFHTVVAVGHSQGSAVLAGAITLFPGGIDAVAFTGSGHTLSATTSAETATAFSPAAGQAPRFARLDPGYVTSTTLADRVAVLYDRALADPKIIAGDFLHRDVMTLVEFATRPANLPTASIAIPQLLLDGTRDSHYCSGVSVPVPANDATLDDCSTGAGLYASERAHYGPCLATAVVPSGHDIATSFAAPRAADLVLRWIGRTVHSGVARCSVTGTVD
jgi:pimeloyl-ACP methyl ester carboxylesterase